MALIDEAGVRSLATWNKTKPDVQHDVTIVSDKNPLILNVGNDRELAQLAYILMRNGVKYIVDDISKISEN